MDSQGSSDTAAKSSPFEDLSREEIISKCKGLLAIAQKAKQSWLESKNEAESYKVQLEKCKSEKKQCQDSLKTFQELIDSLTEQKLNIITEVDTAQSKVKALTTQCKNLEAEINKYKSECILKEQAIADVNTKISDLDSEVVSLKRQNNRLVEENEQLINQLTEIEARTAEFNDIGLQQREQLKKLEEVVHSDEHLKLKIEEFNSKISTLEKELHVTKEEKQKQGIEFECKIKEITELYESEKCKKEKANIKLRSYKDKILKCAACINQLKNSRYILTKTVKEYSENIPKWRNDIINASRVLDEQLLQLNNENTAFKEEIRVLKSQVKDLLENENTKSKIGPNAEIDALQKIENELRAQISELQHQLNKATNKNTAIQKELDDLKLDNAKLTENKSLEKQLHQQKNAELKQQYDEISNKNVQLQETISQLQSEIQIANDKVQEFNDRIVELVQQADQSKVQIEKLQQEIASLQILNQQLQDNELPMLMNENKLLKDRINENIRIINDLRQSYVEAKEYAEELKVQNRKLNNLLAKKSESNSSIETLNFQIKALESEKATLVKEKMNAKDSVIELENSNKTLTEQNTKINLDLQALKQDLDRLTQEKSLLEIHQRNEQEGEINLLKCKIMTQEEQFGRLKKEYDDILDLNNLLKEEVETLKLSLEQPKEDNLSDLNVSLQADIVKLETKLASYKQENSLLLAEMKESRHKVKECEAILAEYEENKEKLQSYKSENAELLNEMKEINQVLKERGESISKQQKAIAEMERLIETLEKDRDEAITEKNGLLKRIDKMEGELLKAQTKTNMDNDTVNKLIIERDRALKQLEDNEHTIAALKEEIEKLKNSSSELPNEDLSTSTISKAEENARMRDLDDSFEDKYTKLRVFALKLKKKLIETTAQLQTTEQDKVKLEKMLQEKEQSGKGTLVTSVDNKEGSGDTEVVELQNKVTSLTEVSERVSSELDKLKAELNAKTLELTAEIEAHKVTKDCLDKAKRDVKKKNVLSLEMEDYERSLKDLTAKMEEKKKKMVQMESTIDAQEGTITAMRTQIKLLEEQIKTEENQNRLTKEELHHALEECKDKDNMIQVKNNVIQKLEQELEEEKRKNEEADLEMTTVIGEKEKIIMALGEDKAELNNKVKKLEFKCSELNEKLKITEMELADLKTEYTSYKVRAQSVLRQNQTVDHSQEEQLKEEAAALRAQIENLTTKYNTALEECAEQRNEAEAARRRASEAASEAARAQHRTARLHADLTRISQQLDSERTQHKLQVSTLTQCYKTQISDLEAKLAKETELLKKQLAVSQERAQSGRYVDEANNQYMLPVIPKEDSDGEMDINVSMIPREEGEGSESAPSPPPSKPYTGGSRSPVPLERLLEEGVPEDEALDASSLDLTAEQEIADLKRRLTATQQRVKHVTVLLSESERECARLAQLSELLKAELRRLRGTTNNAHNAQYMKNVTLKFLTLPPGDERSRLVPVLQKLLTLTPEETQQVSAVAKGQDPNPSKGWGSYLPWPGGSK